MCVRLPLPWNEKLRDMHPGVRTTKLLLDSSILIDKNMKYIFNNHGRNTICESKVKQYIAYLNDKLINYVGSKVLTNAKQHVDYIKEISKPRQILALPKNVSKRKSIFPSNF